MPTNVFGESVLLDDGRRVLAPWNARGVFVDNTFFDGPQIRLPDAVLTPSGRIWIVGKNQAGNGVSVIHIGPPDRFWLNLPRGAFGSRCIVRADGENCLVAFTVSATEWVCFGVSISDAMFQVADGPVPTGAGGRGMRGWDSGGNPLPLVPLDSVVANKKVRTAVTASGVTIGCGLPPLVDSTVMEKDGVIGTISLDESDWPTPRLSPNGKFWAGTRYTPPAVLGGPLPLVVPPLIEGPPVIPLLPKRVSTAWFFDTGAYGQDPNAPGDWSIVADTGVVPTKPFIITRFSQKTEVHPVAKDLIEEHKGRWNQVCGIYITTESGPLGPQAAEALERQRQLGLPLKPLYSYTGRTVDAALDVADITYVGIECYLAGNESPEDGEHRWRNEAQKIRSAGRQAWLVCQSYHAPTDTLKHLMGRFPEVARDIDQEMVLSWFAWLRPDGGDDHGLGPWARATMNATTPMPVPAGSTSVTAKATIESFESPIKAGQTSRAVAKLTQGDPHHAWYQWQYLDGTWKPANKTRNPATDNDHHYALPVGSWPIRLQTWDDPVSTDPKHMTDQTGQARVIVVQATTPVPPEPIPPGPQPPTPGPGEVVLHLSDMRSELPIAGADAWSQLTPTIIKQTDAAGYAVLKAMASGVCVRKAGYHSPGLPNQTETCKPISTEVIQLVLERVPPPPPPVPDIHPAGKIFMDAANKAWRYKAVSGFQLCDRFAKGENIMPFFDAYREIAESIGADPKDGYNTIRNWAYTDWKNPQGAFIGWNAPPAHVTREFFEFCAEQGYLVEYTLLTNDSQAQSDWARDYVAQLAESPRPRVFIEGRNEPQTHSQTVSTKLLKPALDASGFVYASGNYEQSANAFGPYLVAHTQRDSEWPRRAHDLMDYFNGKGPHKPTDPAHKVPCLGDEPPKLQDVQPPKAPLTKADDWRAYFGTCALLGAGATFHSETGKWGLPPTAEERVLAAAALEGLNAFPADAPLGNYTRPSDQSLRTYIVGNYMVRIRPTTDKPPVSGFTRIGTSNILWRK